MRPKRTQAHILEELSERYLIKCLPENWTLEKPKTDYGIDCIIQIFDDFEATPYEIIVQLKSSSNSKGKNGETVKLKTSTFNHLMRHPHISMIIKYVEEKDEAYWGFLSDLPAPDQKNKTYTFQLDRSNILSKINWSDVADYIKKIVDWKLVAGEEIRTRIRNNNRNS